VWDLTCANTLSPTYACDTAGQPGAAAQNRETQKKRKYAFLRDCFLLVLVAFDVLGVYEAEVHSCLGRTREIRNGDAQSAFFQKQSISLFVPRGNTAAILGSLPAGKGFSEIFNL